MPVLIWKAAHLCPPHPCPNAAALPFAIWSLMSGLSGVFEEKEYAINSLGNSHTKDQWAHDHTLLSFEKHFWCVVAQITNTYSSHLESVPTSLPAMAPELDTEWGLHAPILPHRLHWALSLWHSKPCHCHHSNTRVDPRPSCKLDLIPPERQAWPLQSGSNASFINSSS